MCVPAVEGRATAEDCRQPLEAAKGQDINSLLEPPEVETLIFTYKTHFRLPACRSVRE